MAPPLESTNENEESCNRLPEFIDERNEGRNRWHWRCDTPEKYQTIPRGRTYRIALTRVRASGWGEVIVPGPALGGPRCEFPAEPNPHHDPEFD